MHVRVCVCVHVACVCAYVTELALVYVCVITVVGVLAVVVLGLYLETLVFFFTHLYNWKPRDKAKWLMAVYPVGNPPSHTLYCPDTCTFTPQ